MKIATSTPKCFGGSFYKKCFKINLYIGGRLCTTRKNLTKIKKEKNKT